MFSQSPFLRTFCVIIAALLGFDSAAWAAEPHIAVSKSPLSLPFFVAKEKNLFAKHKVAPVLTECLGGIRCMKELIEGRASMATASELPFMFAAFEKKPISLIATFVTNKDDMKFMARKGVIQGGQGGLKGLVGKRIGYVERSASHYFMDLFLLYHGLDPNSVVRVPMGTDALPVALAKGEVDAISVWEPWGHAALLSGGDKVMVINAPKLYSQTFNLMVGNDYGMAQARKTGAVLSALDEAIQFIKKNPEESMRIMARDAGIDLETVKAAWSTYQFELSMQQSLFSTVQGQARWAQREGHVAVSLQEPEFLKFMDASFLRKIKPNAVDFVYP